MAQDRRRLGGEVRAELARQEKSRTALAAELGISREALRRRLNGVQPFQVEELDTVAVFLGVPFLTVMSWSEEKAA